MRQSSRAVNNPRLDVKDTTLRAQEQELKRARGAISCAECRRLKLKCDKTIPCASCKRRGCASICPNGSLTTGQGTRFVLADTERLHRKIAEMSDRIRQLEDALAVLQLGVSRDQHPLLRRDLMKIKSGLDLHVAGPDGDGQDQDADDDASEQLDSFGTLAVREGGASTFYGRSAGSESLLLEERDQPRDPPRNPNLLPPEISELSERFPNPPAPFKTDMQTLIESYLPSWQRAWQLSDLYLEQECWHYGAVTRKQLMDEILPEFYPESVDLASPSDPSTSPAFVQSTGIGGPHDLALMFVVFCFGALTDPSLPPAPDNEEADFYYQLSRAAMNLEPVLEKPPSVATVQTLSLMGIYRGMCAGENSIESTWAMFGLATKLAQTIGLHHDCARWKLSPSETQKRRALFWEIFITDCWQSLATGRLPTFSLPFVDCELPADTDQTMLEDGTVEPSFPYWKAKFGKEVVSAIVQGTLTSQAPKYSIIIELDRKIREMDLPPYAQGAPPQGRRLGDTMKHFMPIVYRNLTLVYVHRCFFAQAITDHPADPLRSPYAPSFLAGYRSACELLGVLRSAFEMFPAETVRFWVLWTHGFSCSMLLASVATHAPRSKVAKAALMELRLACDLYEKAALHGGRAVKFLPIIRRLHQKAHQALLDLHHGVEPTRQKDLFSPTPSDEKKDELSIFSGRTHTVETKTSNVSHASHSSSRGRRPQSHRQGDSPRDSSTARTPSATLSPTASNSNPSTPPYVADSPPESHAQPFAGVHPSLVDQLQGFDGELNAQIHDAYKDTSMRAWLEQTQALSQPPQHHQPHVQASGLPAPSPMMRQGTYDHHQPPSSSYQHPQPSQQHYGLAAPAVDRPELWTVPRGELEAQYPTHPSQPHHPPPHQQPIYHQPPLPLSSSRDDHGHHSLQDTWASFMTQWQMPGR
ncbi:hypothetical protein JAAARDRAFT_36304 [Jaapia argillacea MUCL 33604]|uniref:Zn(2)-C6 fungal-type domain-containing protein n=1 Tax=Jaapia argillacea MUCL 33604 TaxID=933084 RepID=A0A067PPU6_9AGAM|nr:hypothetical protein JAAARDRAFT_36304 [Jaapia argillacea MUCL 33604]